MYLKKASDGKGVVPCVINGEALNLPDSQNFPVIQGSTGETVHYAQSATVEVAIAAADASWKAFKSWKKTTVDERRDVLLRAADILERRGDEAAKRNTTETSASNRWTPFDVMYAAKQVREAASCVTTAVHGTIPSSSDPEVTSLVFKEPIGPVLIIPPWNAPLILAFRGIAHILAAGCSVVLKASEICPFTHQIMLECLKEAGLPAGVVNQVQCARKDAAAVTEALIAHQAIRKVEFIGSAAVGKIIGSVAAKYLKPVLMELGDQSPAIILEDADLKAAAGMVVAGALAHHGQLCFGTERIIVVEKVKDAFSKELVAAMKTIPEAGDASSAEAAKKAQELILEAVKHGAEFLAGNADLTGKSSLTPSILTNLNPKSRINHVESFAPTASLYVVKDADEALARANETEFGLSASVWTQNYKKAIEFARELDFGQVQVNGMTMYADVHAPATGYKGSGWGSNNGRHGVEEFLFNKWVSLR
ncbi:hypothetical protein H2204_004013 [Knufia peltigerae]|uniref:Aldehyde dehydrogenase domain-containing protein n=1 Tax=Knufia peltigerae TaxID=1002370 RepID=A0AA38Y9M8_9EURO|nr:hypothetical protein H2204_004013 [Knufia peltigerae]